MIYKKKMTFYNFTFFPVFDKSNPLIFQMCSMRSIIAYLCPNIINFDVVEFSERRSEKVMFL